MFHFQHHPFVGLINAINGLGHYTVQPCAFKATKPFGCDSAIGCCRRQMDRRCNGGENLFECLAPFFERYSPQITTAFAEDVEEHKGSRGLFGEQFDA
jgi:hypothetical protein